MLDGCIYHQIKSFVPACQESAHDFQRLEYLCAITLVGKKHFSHDVINKLSKLPKNVFKCLFKASICEYFYEVSTSTSGSGFAGDSGYLPLPPESLLQLVLHWPAKILNLAEVLPDLPPIDINKSVDKIRADLQNFYNILVDNLTKSILDAHSVNWNNSPEKKDKKNVKPVRLGSELSRLDVSGYSTVNNFPGRRLLRPRNLCCILRDASNSYSLVGGRKFELFVDIWIGSGDLEAELTEMETIAEINSQSENSLSVFYKKVVFDEEIIEPNSELITRLSRVLESHGTKYLEIVTSDICEDFTTKLCANLPPLRALCLSPPHHISSLNCLTFMNRLEQLDLSYTNLAGKLGPLCNLTNGLLFLKLACCNLGGEDMNTLVISPHTDTLRQLDLSYNCFAKKTETEYEIITYKEDCPGFNNLCEKLVNLEVLDCKGCVINQWPEDQIVKFIGTLKNLPKLCILNISEMCFTSQYLLHCVELGKSISLRHLTLSIPTELHSELFDESVDPESSKKHIDEFKKAFSQSIFEKRENPLAFYLSLEL